MRDLGVEIYVGDHPADMAAARAAEVTAVGVLTGCHTANELVEAGAEIVLDDLTGFPVGWTAPSRLGWADSIVSLMWLVSPVGG